MSPRLFRRPGNRVTGRRRDLHDATRAKDGFLNIPRYCIYGLARIINQDYKAASLQPPRLDNDTLPRRTADIDTPSQLLPARVYVRTCDGRHVGTRREEDLESVDR